MKTTFETDEGGVTVSLSEWKVLEFFWANGGSCFARDVFAEISKTSDISIKTVRTFLSRLITKGFLKYRKHGKSYRYFAVVTREDILKEELRRILRKRFQNDYAAFFRCIINEDILTAKEFKEILSCI